MKKQVNKKRVKFFGIKVAKDDNIDYQNLIARMFMCPYFTPEHAIQYTQMLENGELSVERLEEMIEDETLSAAINNDRSDEVMQEQLKEWENLLGPMTDEDKAYLYENYGFKVTPRKNDKKTDIVEYHDFNSPKEMSAYVKQRFKGQDETIDQLSVIYYMQYMSKKYGTNNPIRSALTVGRTGTGKSGICNCFEQICNLPSLSVNSCHFSPTGYRDVGLSEIIMQYMESKGYSEEDMKYFVLHVEEVDKFARKGEYNDAMMEQIMQFDNKGNHIVFNRGINLSSGSNQICRLCTDNWLIVLDGAFEGIEEIVKARLNLNKNLGFSKSDGKELEAMNLWKHIEPEDIVKYGFKNELVRRIGCICSLNPLTKDTIYKILSEAKENILQLYVNFSKLGNIDLKFTDDALMFLANDASNNTFGIGSVKKSIFKMLWTLYYDHLGSATTQETIVIDKDYVAQQLKTR